MNQRVPGKLYFLGNAEGGSVTSHVIARRKQEFTFLLLNENERSTTKFRLPPHQWQSELQS